MVPFYGYRELWSLPFAGKARSHKVRSHRV
jgi:hypothetical protein